MMSFLRDKISTWLSPLLSPLIDDVVVDANEDINTLPSEHLALQAEQVRMAVEARDWSQLYALLHNANKHLFAQLPDILHLVIISKNRKTNADSPENDKNSVNQILYENEVIQLLFKFIHKGWIDINHKQENDGNYTALHLSILHEDFEIFEKLLESNANINAQNFENATPVHFATQNPNIVWLLELIETGKADLNANTINQQTPLFTACYKNHDIHLDLLLENGALLTTNKYGSTPVMMLLNSQSSPCVDLIWKKEKEYIDHLGNTLLHRLCKVELSVFTKKLIEETDCDFFQAVNHDLQTPLLVAAKNDCTKCLLLLAKHPQVDLNAKDRFGLTALAYTIRNNAIDAAQLLLSLGAKGNIQTPSGTLMHLAVTYSKSITILYKHDPTLIHMMDGTNYIPFQYALLLKKRESICMLILLHKKSNTINRKYTKNQTLLHMAAVVGDHEAIAELMKCDAEMLQDVNGNTPLHLAVTNNHPHCVKLFLQNTNQAAFIHLPNQDGKCAFELIAENQKVLKLFETYDAKIRAEKNAAFIRSRLLASAKKDKTDVYKVLESVPPESIRNRQITHLQKNKKKITESEPKVTTSIHRSFLYSDKSPSVNVKQKARLKHLLDTCKIKKPWVQGKKLESDMLIEIFWDDWWGENSAEKLAKNKLINGNIVYIKSYFENIVMSKSCRDKSVNIVGTTTVNALLSSFTKLPIKTGDTDILLVGVTTNEFQSHMNTIEEKNIWWHRSNYYTYQTSLGAQCEALKLLLLDDNPLDMSFVDENHLHENLDNRDFTITGILLNLIHQTIVCPREWLKDLLQGLIRCIDEPNKSFAEDFTRKIRALRIYLLLEKLNFKFEPLTKIALTKPQKNAFSLIEVKLILYQLEKLFIQAGITKGLELLREYNLHAQMVTSKTQLDYLFTDNVFVFNKTANQNQKLTETSETLQQLRHNAFTSSWKTAATNYLSDALQKGLELENSQDDVDSKTAYKEIIHFICTLLMTGAEGDFTFNPDLLLKSKFVNN